MRRMIAINRPEIDREEADMVLKVLESGVLTALLGSGPMVKRFEKNFADFVCAKHAIAVNSGTAALHIALLAAGVKAGDEVILPSFTFVSTAEMVVAVGAKPVFVDIEPETYNIDPQRIEGAITRKTKAVVPVDLYGLSADMQAISDIARRHSLTVIEDSAQAHGASYMGEPPGFHADLACWSFYGSKNMTTGEGGMVTTSNDEYAGLLRCLRSHGEKEEYLSSMLGYNYRMPEIEAAIGIVQLGKLPNLLEKRRRNALYLTENLQGEKKLQLPFEPHGYKHSWYLYTVRLRGEDEEARNKVVKKLRRFGVGAAAYYATPIHQMPYYRQFADHDLPETERAAQQVFSLPVHPGVTRKEVEYIVDLVKKSLR